MRPAADRVSRSVVLRHWLDRELDKRGETLPTAEMDDRELLAALMERTGGENRPLWRPRETTWYHAPLDAALLRRLRTIAAPEGLGWDRVAPDERVLTAARQVRDGTADGRTEFVDAEHVREVAVDPSGVDDLVLATGQTTTPPRVVDGNHRAVALAVHLLDGGDLPDVDAYVGLVRTRPLAALVDKLRWLARGHLRGEWW